MLLDEQGLVELLQAADQRQLAVVALQGLDRVRVPAAVLAVVPLLGAIDLLGVGEGQADAAASGERAVRHRQLARRHADHRLVEEQRNHEVVTQLNKPLANIGYRSLLFVSGAISRS